MSKIKNISLLCVLLSAGSAIADPGPILSEDGKTFQLNFPPAIVDKLNEFVSTTEEQNQKSYEAFPYKVVVTASGSSLCEAIHKDFWMIIQATAPYIDVSSTKRESLLSSENLVRTARTLLILDHAKILIPALSVISIQIALDYFLSDHAGMSYALSCGNYPRRRQKLNPIQQVIEDYKDALEEIALTILK
jgi:hypothetical protein